ncbi:MAG: ACP phosphodiesterase [Prolixibacteraceae bacterium]|jgi:acyl carrier protein phosphodiesterase|nr:ACP phosphodiesterase [Prolixibacteraceae bacterium]
MNFLAHLYLSGSSDGVKVGNFIGDHVKGKQYLSYPGEIRTGILLHRQIDSFTDNHPIVKECADLLRPVFRRYSGIVVDLYFDHFLASLWDNYSDQQLKDFTRHVHAVLLKHFFLLPAPVKQFLPFLIQSKRLQSYAEIDGITRAIEIMGNYTSLPSESLHAKTVLYENYDFLRTRFVAFFQEIIHFTEEIGDQFTADKNPDISQ